ncbi:MULTISPECIES: hypothetical protein [unclassified Clostridium]|jgi:hypothetical protein|uniref:hypothetical protein n=1 Tax=Clostridia TaxID=186801 RepID=UPI0011061D31|nr:MULTISPECIES: hypothetical protein [unclassified Clostridium]
MDLYEEMVLKIALENSKAFLTAAGIESVLQNQCHRSLVKIKSIISDSSLSDSECFAQIEKIVCIFENLGSDGGDRHDFG